MEFGPAWAVSWDLALAESGTAGRALSDAGILFARNLFGSLGANAAL